MRFNKVIDSSAVFRFDPEFFRRESVRVAELMKGCPPLSSIVDHGYRVVYENTKVVEREIGEGEGLPYFLQSADIQTPFIDEDRMFCVPKEDWNRYPKGRVEHGEVLIEVKGLAEKVAIVPPSFPLNTLVTGTCFKLKPKKAEDGPLLVAYLTSRIGQLLKDRSKTNLLVSFVSKGDLYGLPIPQFSQTLKDRIKNQFAKAHTLHEEAKQQHKSAEIKLLDKLGLDNWRPPSPLTYEAYASSAFSSGRFDAEFYHPKYDSLLDVVASSGVEFLELGELMESLQNGFDIRSYQESGTPYIRVGDVKNGDVDLDSCAKVPLRSNEMKKPVHLSEGDLLFTRKGSFGNAASVQKALEGAIISSEIMLIRPNAKFQELFSAEFLALFINSFAGKLQSEKFAHGAAFYSISQNELAQFQIPVLSKELQDEIVSPIIEARLKKVQSKSLLERAKRAVEIAIEQDEETALAYLDGKHYVADEVLPKLFGLARHYVDLDAIQQTLEAEAIRYESSTVHRYLHEWQSEGRIHDAGRGWYSDLKEPFEHDSELPIIGSVETVLQKEFPLLDYTLWSTRELTGFFQHLPTSHVTYLMVDRDALEPVADSLREADLNVAAHPLGDTAKKFSLEQEDTIILRPRLSADHTETRSPIEHTLVDLYHEIEKLSLFEGEEYRQIVRNLASTHRINITALKRYAERRKIDPNAILGHFLTISV